MWIETIVTALDFSCARDSPGRDAGCGLKQSRVFDRETDEVDSPGRDAGCGLKLARINYKTFFNKCVSLIAPYSLEALTGMPSFEED